MRALLFSILLVAAAACGPKSSTSTSPDNHAEHGMDSDEMNMTPELKNFHDTLAPLWHSEAETRQADTCGAAGNMLELGAAIQDAGAPAGAADDWSDRVTALMVAIDHMKEGCQSESPDFDANFKAVHEDFHGLLDALPKG